MKTAYLEVPVSDVDVLFFDVGGVLLTNGWDRQTRRAAADHFQLDWEEFQDRHDFVADGFETGELSLEEYLTRTVFYRDRAFSRDDFVEHMKAQSAPHHEALTLVGELAASGRYLMATLNNESRPLNEYRIHTFGLRDYFTVFISSCYVGARKPDADIYRIAVDVVQRPPQRCVFIDDRELNLECADLAGINPIHYTDVGDLRRSLSGLGVGI